MRETIMLSNQEKESCQLIIDKLLDHVPGHIYWKNKAGVFLGCNKEQAQCFGFKTVNELIGKTAFDLVDKESAIKIQEIDLQIMESEKIQVVEEKVGSRWFLSKKMPLKTLKGEVIGIFGLSTEITNQKEREFNKGIAIDSLIVHMPGHLYWKNKEGVILGCNTEYAKYLGLKDPCEVIGKTMFDLMNEEDAIIITSIDNRVIQTENIQIAEEARGSKWFLSKKVPLKDLNGEIIGLLGLSLEITEQKRQERALQEKINALAAALEEKERFVRNVNHEIRSPLQVVIDIPIGLRSEYHKLTDQQRLSCLDTMVNSANRLMTLITHLLDLSKFKHGKFAMEFKSEDIKSVVVDVIKEFQHAHDINLNVDQDVPQSFVCDRFRIAQVLRNLIGNSIKYCKKKQIISVSISKYQEENEQYIKCTIKDEGIGVPDGEKVIIFEPFSESTRTRTSKGGTGLGLSISKEIVEAHQGRIWVEDLKDGEIGTRISFLLGTVKGK